MSNCPKCEQRGRKISSRTLSSHVVPDRLEAIEEREYWSMCLSPVCSAVYFREAEVVSRSQVRMLPFHKNEAPDRLVCFYFDHRANEIHEEVLAQGQSGVQAEIKAACRSGRDDCERKNPQGRCCLGNVGLVIKDALSHIPLKSLS